MSKKATAYPDVELLYRGGVCNIYSELARGYYDPDLLDSQGLVFWLRHLLFQLTASLRKTNILPS